MDARLTLDGPGHKGVGLPRAAWQEELLEAPSDVRSVAAQLGFPADVIERMVLAAQRHRFRTTRRYLALVDPDDPADPILAQLLPDPRELDSSPPGYVHDAVGDTAPEHHKAAGLVHKYPGRALLVTTSACAVYCRFCFRRAFPYEELASGGSRLAAARAVIAEDPTITEVILSGGDPLSWTDAALRGLLADLAAIPHVRRVRVHTRMPVVLPSRITEGLIELFTASRLGCWFVTHFNHPREVTPETAAACRALVSAGIPVLNQSVLLRGVNDDAATLGALCELLVDLGVKPYYLHQLDRVHGTAHFEVPEDEARGIVERLRRRVSGIAMPSWVRDVPGQLSKTPLVLLLLGLLMGCGEPAQPETTEPERLDRSLAGVEATTPEQPDGADATPDPDPVPEVEAVESLPAGPVPPAERVLVADLFGDGKPEVFVADGSEVRWGEWPDGAAAPLFKGRHAGKGMLQAWMAHDLDGDGDDEVALAFGLGRGFPEARTEIFVINDFSKGTVARPVWRSDGERNQVTALQPWPKPGGGADLYVGHFVTRFTVRGGVLDWTGGEPAWLPSHEVRMGMARAVGDFDGDGIPEVAVGRLYGETADTDGDLRVLQEDGSVEMVPTVRGVRAVGAGDLNGDGRAELLFGDGWHKNYGKLARYRPNVGRRGPGGIWNTTNLDERSDNYAVEHIGVAGTDVVAGGNATLGVYRFIGGAWALVGGHQSVKATGSWAALPTGGLVLSGEVVSRFRPGSVDVALDEQKQGDGQKQP